MALLDTKLYSNNVLVVGDGNFSFTVCLASALSETTVKIVATSLDSPAALANNDFAVENIEKLSAFQNVEILHEVDATNLSKTFGSKIFDRVIFNFPHIGGKSNIGKSRELLERFFASAARHVEPYKGDICVSLCQGQGGTPLDNPRRELGNTWQVVYQAAKAGLILNAVYPFRSIDYTSYRSAGFRGQLGKGFHTVNGLTHMFVHGVPLETVPDLENFMSNHKNILGGLYPADGLSCVPGNPVYILVNKLKSFFSNYIIGDTFGKTVGPFDNHSQSEGVSSTNQQAEELNVEEEVVSDKSQRSLLDTNFSLSSRVLQKIQANCHSFVLSGTEIDFFLPPSSQSHPISHKLVAVQMYAEAVTASKVKADMGRVLEEFIREICSCLEDLKRESSCQSSQTDSSDATLAGSETIQLKSGRQTKFQNFRNAAGAGTRCECRKQAVQEKCIFCRLESHYLGYDISSRVCLNDLFQPFTQTELYHKERLLLSCGVLDSNKFSKVCCGWLIEVNLDNLVMALCGISDVRLLWSQDQRFKEQFSSLEVHAFPDARKKFVPFSLFPPMYIHDISFWITEHMTEQQFFQDIYETTQGCVCEVWFIERYHDTEQDKVSYNYRMAYSSCDRPLSHIQTVQMQNLLRRKLLNCDFPLK
ncbi:ferredoxin-fold anticodon-binding domain-containing protein 1-like [Oculina patagonica]